MAVAPGWVGGWVGRAQPLSSGCSPQCRIDIPEVAAGTVYDVLHDAEYRRQWDTNVIASHDIARVAANANVSYYACEWGPSCFCLGHGSGSLP